MKDVEFLNLDFLDEDIRAINTDLGKHRRKINDFLSESRKKAKRETCMYCEKAVKGFCNSHSIPAFSLRNIATNGEVYYSNAWIEIPLMDIDKGINRAGTFKIICKECDGKVFSAYENPENYEDRPSPKMLAQIAMKNYLKQISKRLEEYSIYKMVSEINPLAKEFTAHMHEIQKLDLGEAKKGFEKAKRLSKKNQDREYYLFYYEKLDYITPIAFQSSITLITDLDGQIINNIYNLSPKYPIQELHICIFPLQGSTVVMMFVDAKYKRYRDFYKQFSKLTTNEKLGVINYIIFLYSEDVFISKEIPNDILKNERLIEVSKQSALVGTVDPDPDVIIKEAKKVYDLRKWDSIPNLLEEQYKI